MKFILSVALPITILTFALISCWRFGIVIDGTSEFFYGYPFIHKCRVFHTSLSTQYFIKEALVNFIIYFAIITSILKILDKRIKIEFSKKITRIFWIGFAICGLGFLFLSNQLNDMYLIQRDFEIVEFDKGISILGTHPNRESFKAQLTDWIEKNNAP